MRPHSSSRHPFSHPLPLALAPLPRLLHLDEKLPRRGRPRGGGSSEKRCVGRRRGRGGLQELGRREAGRRERRREGEMRGRLWSQRRRSPREGLEGHERGVGKQGLEFADTVVEWWYSPSVFWGVKVDRLCIRQMILSFCVDHSPWLSVGRKPTKTVRQRSRSGLENERKRKFRRSLVI